MPKLFVLFYFCVAASALAASDPAPTGETEARTFPFSMIGQVDFFNGHYEYIGSGTVIKPSSVLTAGHVMWDPYYGWSTRMLFSRSLYRDSDLSEQYARYKYLLAGYSTNAHNNGGDSLAAFANDMGAMRFKYPVAGGASAAWADEVGALTAAGGSLLLGYGADFHPGDELLSVTTSDAFYDTRGGFFENDTISIEGGMSGGPVLNRESDDSFTVTGVVVSGSDDPVSGGIRVIDTKAGRFITRYLR